MSTWIPVVVLIVVVLAAGLLRERFRVAGIERWARMKGFVRPVPFAPAPASPAATLAARLHPRGARLWGVGLEGMVDAAPCTIAEYATARPGRRTGDDWFTLAYWPARDAVSDPEAISEDGVLVRDGGYTGLRLPGLLTTGRLEELMRRIPEARQRLA